MTRRDCQREVESSQLMRAFKLKYAITDGYNQVASYRRAKVLISRLCISEVSTADWIHVRDRGNRRVSTF